MQELDLGHYQNRHSLKSKVARVIWNVVWFCFFQTTPRGNFFCRWRILLLKMFRADIKWTSNVLPSCRIWQPWKLHMGDCSCLSAGVDCYSVDEIVIGDQVVVSQEVKLCTAGHDITSRTMELTHQPIRIESNAWIAAWSIVLPGVTIGEGAVIGAGAVVTKDVEAWTVVGGNPAKVIKKRVLNASKG